MTNAAATPTAAAVRPKRWRKRVAYILAALLFLVIAGEVSLRVIFGLGSPLLYQVDPDCGYLPKPDQHIHRFFSNNSINHEGMRSPEFQMPRPAGTFRVLVIGDSVTYALSYVDQSLIWTTLLNRELPKREHRPIEILNASAGGWAPANEWGYLRSRGTFDANVVAFVCNTGDLGESMASISAESLAFPQKNPATAIGEVWSRYLEPRIFHRDTSDPGTTLPSADVLAKATEENLQIYTQALDFCRQHHVPFCVIYIPFPREHEFFDSGPHKSMLDWASAHHVPVVDLLPRISKEKVSDISRDGVHPNPHGDQIIAEEIVKQWKTIASASNDAPAPSAATQH